MAQWTKDKLARIGKAEEIEITSRRRDGTLRKAVTIWVVAHGDSLYVRSVKGRDGAWFRAAQETREGRISAAGRDEDITFVAADQAVNAQVDSAFKAKYHRYAGPILNSVLTPEARSTTTRLEPQSTRASQ